MVNHQRLRRRWRRAVPDGNSHPSLFPYEPLPAPTRLIVTAGNDQQFRKLVDVLGELADDPRFAKNPDRTARRHELRLLVERLSTRTRMEWFRDTSRRRIPCGPINTVDQGVAFAEDIGLDPVVDVGPDGASVGLSATPSRSPRPRPRTGSRRLRSTSTAEIRRWLSEEVSP